MFSDATQHRRRRPVTWLRAAWCSVVLSAGTAFAQNGATTPIPSIVSPAIANTTALNPDTFDVSTLCQGARRGDVEALNQLAWIYAYGKGVERNDAYASYLFFAASGAGHAGAKRMLGSMSWPAAEVPKCMEDSAENRYVPNGAVVVVDAPAAIVKIVQKLAPRYQLDPRLVLAIIDVESRFDIFALSPKNAMGLMQLMPKTTERFGVAKPFDAQDNIRGGMAYLRWLLAYFEGDLVLVSAAYNAGEGAVEKYRGIPPFAETQDYVRKVLERVGTVQHAFDVKAARPSSALPLMTKSAKLD